MKIELFGSYAIVEKNNIKKHISVSELLTEFSRQTIQGGVILPGENAVKYLTGGGKGNTLLYQYPLKNLILNCLIYENSAYVEKKVDVSIPGYMILGYKILSKKFYVGYVKNSIVNFSDKVYTWPLPNVYASYEVCQGREGEALFPETTLHNAWAISYMFLTSNFNHHLFHGHDAEAWRTFVKKMETKKKLETQDLNLNENKTITIEQFIKLLF